MDLFRLTYFIGGSQKEDKWSLIQRFEVFGGPDAISDLYFHLKCLQKLRDEGKHESSCPVHMNILSKDGHSVLEDFKKYGRYGLVNCNTFS